MAQYMTTVPLSWIILNLKIATCKSDPYKMGKSRIYRAI